VGVLLAAASVLAGCGASTASSSASAATAKAKAYPVTVTSCGVPVTYDRAPARAVSNDINTTEDMLALGLEPRMAGTFGVTGDGPVGQPVPAQYLAGFHRVRDVSSDYFTKEELVGLRPDFLFAGWNYGLEEGTSLTPQGLAQFGIKTLVLTESCVHVQKNTTTVSIGDTYQDLRNLGEIFNVRARAQHVIAAMQAQVAAARSKISGLKPVTVFDYDSGNAAPFTGAGLATPNALISLGGGTNIFASLKQSFTSVSWEQVIKADPQCIIINDYGTPTAAQKEKFLETSPIPRNLTAVKNHCFLPLSYDEVTPGPRNAQAAVAIAHWLHPAAFGLPADGS
jgi:iron complex transport system substrate-binding protein